MNGRETQKENDLFYTCSLIEYIGRKTKNKRSDVVNALGKASVSKIYELADIYHSDNIERVSDDFIEIAGITDGSYDNVAAAKYAVPSHWDMGKVYKRLILGISKERNMEIVDALFIGLVCLYIKLHYDICEPLSPELPEHFRVLFSAVVIVYKRLAGCSVMNAVIGQTLRRVQKRCVIPCQLQEGIPVNIIFHIRGKHIVAKQGFVVHDRRAAYAVSQRQCRLSQESGFRKAANPHGTSEQRTDFTVDIRGNRAVFQRSVACICH